MLLAFEIGNTNIHLGLWNGSAWQLNWRVRTVADKMPDEYAMLVRSFLQSAEMSFDAVDGVIISSVVPALTRAFVELSRRYLHCEPVLVNHQTNLGIGVEIDQPEQAGADRLANAVAVVHLYGGGPAIVVDFGTATNFDLVSEDGAYIGGAIAPGIGVAHDALVSRAARLHKIDLVPPPNPIGRNTVHAMQSGIFWGYVGLVEGLVTRLKAAMGHEAIQVIATGGLAPLFTEHTQVIDRVAPELTLDGLRVVYELNHKGQSSKNSLT